MPNLNSLFSKYDRLVIFDTETTGLQYARDEIIEFAAIVVERIDGVPTVLRDYDELVKLSPGGFVPQEIQNLTGITDLQLLTEGVEQEAAVEAFCRLLEGAERPLLVAYNAQFDLNFLYYFLQPYGRVSVLRAPHFLDALTVYKDRASYPHKLLNAIDHYGLTGKVVNSHRAVDDVIATVAVMEEMEKEKDDLLNYVNLFGYNPKYGIEGKAIGSVTYKPQPYNPKGALYEV